MKLDRPIIVTALVAVITASFMLLPSRPSAQSTPSPTQAAVETPDESAAPRTPAPTIKAADLISHGKPERLFLRSGAALVVDDYDGSILLERNIDTPRPIASLTKLMTAMVILDAGLSLEEEIEITRDDRDRLRGSRSRLPYGWVATRRDLLLAALAASDNRAAAALGRTFPGGTPAIVAAMNQKAQALGLRQTHFDDTSGLSSDNVSTARELAKLVAASSRYPLFHTWSTNESFTLHDRGSRRRLDFVNTNRLVRRDSWDIEVSKTGYTADAGNCLVMQATLIGRPVTIVLLNSWGKLSKYGDAQRIRDWLKKTEQKVVAANRTVASAPAP